MSYWVDSSLILTRFPIFTSNLEVLEKKVDDIDGEARLLHELKKIILEFIDQIKKINFENFVSRFFNFVYIYYKLFPNGIVKSFYINFKNSSKFNRFSDGYAYRMYDERAVKRLEQILILRRLNISVKDIKRIFSTEGSKVVLEVLEKKFFISYNAGS